MFFYNDNPTNRQAVNQHGRYNVALMTVDQIMAEIPAVIAADSSMTDAEKNRLSRLYDTLLILQEMQDKKKERPAMGLPARNKTKTL